MKFRTHTLENGLQIVAECNEHAYSTSLAYFVNTGSRDEEADVAGVSHFLEHMVFKGTPRRSAADVNRELDEMGSHSNAYTTEEQTVYYATVLPEYQDQLVELLSDIMRPSLREDDFASEKKVIIEEIYKYDDQPPFGAAEKCMEAYYGGHPLGNNVLGTVESVDQMTPQGMREYFTARYSPGNMSLVACGNVDFDALVTAAEQYAGSWNAFDTRRNTTRATGTLGHHRLAKPMATQEYAVQISAAPSATDPLRFASRLLSYALGDDGGSRLYWALVDPGLAEYAGSSPHEFDGDGIMMTYLCCGPDEAAGNLEQIQAIQEDTDASGITADELELAKSKICSQLVRRSERPSNRLFSVGTNWLLRSELRSVKESIDAYQAVTLDDIHAVVEKFPLSTTMTVAVGPAK